MDLSSSVKQWLQARGLEIPVQDGPGILAAVQSLNLSVDVLASNFPMETLPEPFQKALVRLAPEGGSSTQAAEPSAPELLNRHGQATSEGWVKACLESIHASPLGALAWVDLASDEALETARQRDRERAQGQVRGPLHGVPIGLKDMFDVQGRTAQWGSRLRGEHPAATRDAAIVQRLKTAGAVVLGYQHMAEFAMSPTGLNVHLGSGRNPWNTEHVSGGSSSGAGMSVGAGHVPVAIGSDTGGSVRLPAGLCGVTGLKPTQYRVSLAGAMPLSPSLDCVGPLARTAEECGWVFCAMSGQDANDPSCLELPPSVPGWTTPLGRALTVAVPQLEEGPYLSRAMREAFDETCRVLKEAGVCLIQVPMPDLQTLSNLGSLVLASETPALHRPWIRGSSEHYGRQVRRRMSRGFLVSAYDYFDVLRMRPHLVAAFLQQHLPGADALLLPTTPDGAPSIDASTNRPEDELEREFSRLSWWTRGINYLGLPGLSFMVGMNGQGLPLSAQLIGRPLDESMLIRLGALYQNHTDWHLRRPQ